MQYLNLLVIVQNKYIFSIASCMAVSLTKVVKFKIFMCFTLSNLNRFKFKNTYIKRYVGKCVAAEKYGILLESFLNLYLQ